MMDPFAVASEMLEGVQLSSGQVAQLRAIDTKYQQRMFSLTRAGASPARREPTRDEIAELEAMIRADIAAVVRRGP
jgi:hypothetical protein